MQWLSLIVVSWGESFVRGVSDLNAALSLVDGRACNASHAHTLVTVILVKEKKTIYFARKSVVRKDNI